MTEIITKKYLINGPTNIIRLTNGDKIIYIFGDYHLEPNWQSECPMNDEHMSMDIDKLIYLFMKTEKIKEFDLFAEMYPDMLNEQSYPQKYNYINNFIKVFQAKVKKTDNEVKINKLYPNFRFHFMDIRNTIPMFMKIFYFYNNFNFNETIPYSKFRFNLFEHLGNLEEFIDYLETNQNSYINKIINKYSDKNIKDTMNKLYKNLIIDNLKLVKDTLIETIGELKNKTATDERYNKILLQKFNLIDRMSRGIMCVIIDLYFIRRFLDKNYIKNAILYTGNMHMVNISYLLVN